VVRSDGGGAARAILGGGRGEGYAMKIRRLMKDIARRNQDRRRVERRVLGYHARWSIIGRLRTGFYWKVDGLGPLLRSAEFDLYEVRWFDEQRGGIYATFVHPRWL
jgi:hypothetical protein